MSDNITSHTTISGEGIDKHSATTVTIVRDNNAVSKTFRESSVRDGYRRSFGILSLVVSVLLLASVLGNLIYGVISPVTFNSLLSYLQNAPSVSVIFDSLEGIPLQSDWNLFNFLLPVVNPIISVLNFFILIVRMLWASLDYVFYLVGFFF